MDVVTLGAALSIMKKMPDTAASSAAAAEDAADRAEAAAEQAEGAIEVDDTLSVKGRAADAKKTGDEITNLNKKSMRYRGRILDDGRTSCAECTDIGYYRFSSADVENITDYPQADFTGTGKQSGVLFVYPREEGASTVLYQRIEDYIGQTWHRRSISAPWTTNITDDLGIKTCVVISQKGVTDAIQNLAYQNGMLNNCIKQASGSGGQRLTFALTANAGDTVFYGVTGASADTINYINAYYITSGGTKTAFDSNVQIGQEKNYNLPVDIVGVELYLNATGSTSISGYAIKDNTLIGEVLSNEKLLVDMNAMFATTKTNNGSAIITGISPIEHYVKLEFSQKNLLNPVCTQKLNFDGSSSTGYTLVSANVTMANIVPLNGLNSVTISGDLTGFSGGFFRYVFTSTFPEAGTTVLASGAVRGSTITVPTGAKYLVWITGSQNITSISSEVMLNGGNSAESYVPYVSSFNLIVADDSSLTNSVTYSISNADEPFYVKSRTPQMYIRAVASATITIKQTWYLNPVDVINIGNGIDSLTVGRGQTKVKDKYLCIAVGGNNLSESPEGMKNIAVGFDNMYQTSGSRNTSIGYHALFRNTTANDGTAIGAEALDDNTSGNNNTACGAYALQRNAKGSNNTAVGFRALNGTAQHNVFDANAEYNGNTAIGVMAMENKGSGNNNTAIGYQSMSSQNNVNGCIALGYNAQCEKDNQMMLGGSNITEVIMCGNKKINFNADGTVTWETLS